MAASMTVNQRIHRYLTWLHRWTGLLMTIFLVVVALTGSLLVYTVEIDRIVNPQLFAQPRVGVRQLEMGEIAERVEAADPRVRTGYFFRDIPDTVSVRIQPRNNPATGKPYNIDFDHVFVDPWTGRILGHRGGNSIFRGKINLMPFVRAIHTDLAMGPTGALVLGYVALAWTIDCFVGFYLTLPVLSGDFWRRWRTAWWVKWRANGFRVNFDLHRAGGLWFWPLLFVFAWSSVRFELLPLYDRVMRSVVPYETAADQFSQFSPHVIEHPRLGWREAELQAIRVMQREADKHGFHVQRPVVLAYIEPFGVYSYGVQTDLDFRARNPDTGVYIDGDTGELKHLFLPRGPSGNTFTNLIVGLHFADFRGWQVYRFVEFALGFLITMLSVTGIYIWWRKRQVRTEVKGREKVLQTSQVSDRPNGLL